MGYPAFPQHLNKEVISMNSQQILEIEPEVRAFVFDALSRLLDYPDADLMDQIRDAAYIENFEVALQKAGIGDDAVSFCASLTEVNSGHLLLSLQKEYTHLCFASKPRRVHLFESVYRTGKLMQDCTFDIARLYYDAGLCISDDFDLLPDHISLELEFMSYLGLQESQALSSGDTSKAAYARDLQQKVLTHHLIFFATRLSEAFQAHGRSSFYQTIGRMVGCLFDAGMTIPDILPGQTDRLRADTS
jgi:TorA maturation chaperone TorD